MTYLDPPRPNRKGNPLVEHMKDQYLTGKMNRRQFIQFTALLGVSTASATRFLTAADQAEAAVAATTAVVGTPVRGGTYRIATEVHEVDHPHRLSWTHTRNILATANEYLTYTDPNNITHPYLLEKWAPNADGSVWTLHLRKGIKWTDGTDLTMDDVHWNFKSWLDPKTGSSVLGILGPILDINGVELVDKHTIILHLKQPAIAVPEYLYHYPAMILKKDYEPADIKAGKSVASVTVGTGPFIVKKLDVGSGAHVVRNPDYWQKDASGNALPYLDEIVWTDLGAERAPYLAAIQSGQIDSIDQLVIGADMYQATKDDPNLKWQLTRSGATAIMRMRVDKEPFTDPNVRTAFKLVQPRQEIADTGYLGLVDLGHDAHFIPSVPDYVAKPIPPQDIEKAKALLAASETWQKWGSKPIKMTTKNDTRYEQVYEEVFQRAAKKAGINIELDIRPASEYWPKWNHFDFGVTSWSHRPLNTMLQGLAYTREALPTEEAPSGWNETRWTNDEFLKLLAQANATPDLQERLKLVDRMEDIQMADSGTGVAWFFNVMDVDRKDIANRPGHPTPYLIVTEAWKSAS